MTPSNALLVFGLTTFLPAASAREYPGVTDDAMMLSEVDERPDHSGRRLRVYDAAKKDFSELGLRCDLVEQEVRFGRRPHFVKSQGEIPKRYVFVRRGDGTGDPAVVTIRDRGDEVTIEKADEPRERHRWMWLWANYQNFAGDPARGELEISAVARQFASGDEFPGFSRFQIEHAFDHPLGPPVPHPDFPRLRWHVGDATRGEAVSLIYLAASQRSNVRIYRADPATHQVRERFAALARSTRFDVEHLPGVSFIKGLRAKLAWKHRLTWPELIEAVQRPRTTVRSRDPDDDERNGPTRWEYVTTLTSGKPVLVIFDRDERSRRIVSAREAGRRVCETYLAKVEAQ